MTYILYKEIYNKARDHNGVLYPSGEGLKDSLWRRVPPSPGRVMLGVNPLQRGMFWIIGTLLLNGMKSFPGLGQKH